MEYSRKYAIDFVKQFPTSLQDIEIDFDDILWQDAKVIARDFKVFSACLDGAKLRNISIGFLYLGMVSRKMQKDFIDSLKRLLHNQRSLQKFEMGSSYFDLETGLQILQCLADGIAATIEDLTLAGFFEDELPIYQEERILTEMQKFTGLSRIHFDYYFISEELAKFWVTGCPNLSFISLCADEQEYPPQVISCETWKALVRTHPSLLVEFRTSEIQDIKQLLKMLSPDIPMFDLSWDQYTDVTTDVTTELELTRLLDRVAHYHRTIKHLSLSLTGQFTNLDTAAVQNILSKCTNLLPIQCSHYTNHLWGENQWTLSET